MSLILILTQASAALSLGNCPGAYIDYEYWRDPHNNITRTIPVDITMQAVRELRECRRNGVDVPYTVHEYNLQVRNQRSNTHVEYNEVERVVNPSGRPFHEQ